MSTKISTEKCEYIKYLDGTEEWHLNGELHRLDGPAVTRVNGSEEWFVNGKRHRVDGPAVMRVNGSEEWYLNGKLHRVDGPAIIWTNGNNNWYVNGKIITSCKQFQQLTGCNDVVIIVLKLKWGNTF